MVKSLGWFLAFLAILAAMVFASYACAHHQATALIARIPERFEPARSHFQLLRGLTGQRGPSWVFEFDSQDYFTDIPLSVEVSLTGEVRGTNPSDTLAKIRALR
ncbi:MAG TPA: hypothetical protein VGM54_15955 [Chthoniobacter sp.]|jgi:hypothetical protein